MEGMLIVPPKFLFNHVEYFKKIKYCYFMTPML